MQTRLEGRKRAGLWRSLPTEGSPSLIDLTSNDYLGFSRSREILEKAHAMTDRIGATGSRLLTGNHPLYRGLEEKISLFHLAESCLIYNTGYMANLGLLAAVGVKEATFLYDLEVHASIYDGMRLSHAKCLPFRHNDLNSLERRLKAAKRPIFVLIESIYSISGDIAPVREIAKTCTTWGASLIVDEAHATGVRGPQGEGLCVECGIEDQTFARVHTFSKALGVHGAAVVGSKTLKEYLVNFSRPFIYTTALPSCALAMIACAYKKLQREAKEHQHRLGELIHYFRSKTHSSCDGPIQPLYISGVERLKNIASKIRESGLDVRAIVPPTTARGNELLRVVLHSFNQEEEIDKLVEVVFCNESS